MPCHYRMHETVELSGCQENFGGRQIRQGSKLFRHTCRNVYSYAELRTWLLPHQ
jgi:hypothetical protein